MKESTPSTASKTRSLSFSRKLTKIFTYALLVLFSLIMLLPLLFLLNGSLQPEWQINANPVIWLPRKWLMAQAGTTNRYLNKYLLKDETGEQIETIQVGLRSYTTVADASKLSTFESVPRDQLGDPVPTVVGNLPGVPTSGLRVNERDWKKTDGSVEKVVAMARDLKPVIQPKGVLFAEDAQGRVIGFAIALPDVNALLGGLNGRLFPLGWLKLLWGLPRLRRYRMFALGVTPEYQGKAVDSLLYRALYESLYTPDIWMEINYVLEDNVPMNNAIRKLGARPSRRYRIYQASI